MHISINHMRLYNELMSVDVYVYTMFLFSVTVSYYYPNILTSMFLFFNVLILFVYRTNLNILRYKIADSIIPIKDD
jgi:hypothetical protein